ncbi:MAG: UrcA family protein [Hyphomonadaceae bacterium]
MRRTILAGLAFAFMLSLAPAHAETMERTQRVPFGDLNLADSKDAAELQRRVERAAGIICGDRSGPRSLAERDQVQVCVADITGLTLASIQERTRLANVVSEHSPVA